MNTGNGKFVNVTDRCGDGMSMKLSSRGASFGDFDGDGDVVILNSRREPTILRNDTVNDNHWIRIRLRGVDGNRDGVGHERARSVGVCREESRPWALYHGWKGHSLTDRSRYAL